MINSRLSRLSIWAPNGILLILLGFAGVLLAYTVWLVLLPLPQAPNIAPSRLAVTPKTTPQALATEISVWHLFGQPAPTLPQTATVVQASNLGLKLEGIIAGSQPPLVMLRVGSEVKMFQVGDAITAQVTVHAIEPSRVLISNQGRIEAIAFPTPTSLNSALPPNALSSVLGKQVAPQAAPAATRADATQVMQNPQSLMRFVTVAPLQENGALVGYALRPVPGQEAFMQQLGLEPGDVLTSVDGIPVTDPSLLPRAMPLLSSGQPLNVMIERGGQPMSVTINLDSLQ